MSGEPIRLEPGSGRSLRDLLFEQGVEFPCGGAALCGGCKVRVLAGEVPIPPAMREVLTSEELADGWRLGCLAQAEVPVILAIEQWSIHVLDDRREVPFEPADGCAAVVDVGTTTLVAQAVDRLSGEVTGVETALNPQAVHGADLMSRIRHDLAEPGTLTRLLRREVGAMLGRLPGSQRFDEVLLVGNTVMHHLFCGLSVKPLSSVPFRSPWGGGVEMAPNSLGWGDRVRGPVRFLPCIGGFVGSDLLAGIVAVGLHEADTPGVLLDLGTNGEIAVGDRHGILSASTAAGPAFEGGRIGRGMRAGAGAIDRVLVRDGGVSCTVLGGVAARGICGSGLVDAVAAALELGWLGSNGRIARPDRSIPLTDLMSLSQADVRELQLAKGAVAAGLQLLIEGRPIDASRFFLAGAFGNYVQGGSARRIGLLPEWSIAPVSAGNTALRGARMLLLAGSRRESILERCLSRTTHVELATKPGFQDSFAESMRFPMF